MSSAVVLAFDFGGSKIAMTVADTAGCRLGSTTVATSPRTDAAGVLQRGIAAARTLIGAVAPGRELLAVGACTFGIPYDDHVMLAPTIEGWESLAFGRELRAAFPGAVVQVSTDVKSAALAEVEQGALRGCDPGVYVNLGTGLAAALVIGGVVQHGRDGAAGEIGYSLRRPSDVVEATPPILEQAVSGQALRARAASLGLGSTEARELFARAHTDSSAASIVEDFVAELSMHLVNIVTLINPERVVVGGGITGSWDQLERRLQRALDAHTPFPPAVVRAQHPFDAPLIGALAAALRAVAAFHPVPEPVR